MILAAAGLAPHAARGQVLAPDTGGTVIGERESPATPDEAAAKLKELMPLWSATAHRYETAARRFLATETHRTIDYSRAAGEARKDKAVPYGYLLEIDPKSGALDVVRQTMDEKGVPTGGEKNLDLPFPEPYLWTLIFLPSTASTLRFTYLGREIQNFKLSHVVTFEGSAARTTGKDPREWSGTIWVEENTGDIVRIEARPSFQQDRMAAQWAIFIQSFGLPFGLKTKPRPHGFVLSVLFDFEHEKLLYPTRLDLSDFTWLARDREAMDTRLVLTYDGYRFFKTETEEKVDTPPAAPPR